MHVWSVAQFLALDERYGHERSVSTETGIEHERRAVDRDAEKHVGARRGRSRRHHDDAGRMQRRRKAGILEHGAKQRRVLVAIAAAFCDDELGVDAVEVDADASAEEDVEVFEGDTRHVRAHQRRQRRKRRLKRAAPADAIEIADDVEGAVRH